MTALQSLFVFSATSVPGVKNTREAVMADWRKLRLILKRAGYVFEDCSCTQKTPESHQYVVGKGKNKGQIRRSVGGLWHLHGVMRFEGNYSGVELHDLVSKHWLAIHGAYEVRVSPPRNITYAFKYNLHDILHDYANENGSRQRLMVSKKWIPKRAREFEKKILKPWAWWHGAGWSVDDDLNGYQLGEFIPYTWHVAHAYLLEWVARKGLRLEMKHHLIWTQYPEVLVLAEDGSEVEKDWVDIDWQNE
jgi:hypothetical protein